MEDKEVMTTAEVQTFIGYKNYKGVARWCHRQGVKPIYRQAGRSGQNVYLRADVEEGLRNMVGQGVGGGIKKDGVART
jgi:hypothetical protein